MNVQAHAALPSAPARLMNAAWLVEPRRFEIERVSLVEPGPRQVRVRLAGCGVCGSNLPLWQGRPWFEYPREHGAPGHEGWGIIDAIGREVRQLTEGQPVALLSHHAFAEYDICESQDVAPLPPELADTPFPAEPLACAINAFRRSGIAPGQTVAIVGIGFLGALLVQLATAAGARVIALSRRESALQAARTCGAAETLPLGDNATVIERIRALTDGQLCPVVIEVTGEQEPLNLAAELTAVRGRLVIAGYHQDPRQLNLQLWNWRGLDVINAHERDPRIYVQGMKSAIAAVGESRLSPAPLLTHLFPLSEIDQAFATMEARPAGFLKAWIRM